MRDARLPSLSLVLLLFRVASCAVFAMAIMANTSNNRTLAVVIRWRDERKHARRAERQVVFRCLSHLPRLIQGMVPTNSAVRRCCHAGGSARLLAVVGYLPPLASAIGCLRLCHSIPSDILYWSFLRYVASRHYHFHYVGHHLYHCYSAADVIALRTRGRCGGAVSILLRPAAI